eukprot:jgi/Mesvir1/904/Mv17465-RA.2
METVPSRKRELENALPGSSSPNAAEHGAHDDPEGPRKASRISSPQEEVNEETLGSRAVHTQPQTLNLPATYKTKLCHAFSESGSCARGASCKFAHGEDELREPPAAQSKKFKDKKGSAREEAKPTKGLKELLESPDSGGPIQVYVSSVRGWDKKKVNAVLEEAGISVVSVNWLQNRDFCFLWLENLEHLRVQGPRIEEVTGADGQKWKIQESRPSSTRRAKMDNDANKARQAGRRGTNSNNGGGGGGDDELDLDDHEDAAGAGGSEAEAGEEGGGDGTGKSGREKTAADVVCPLQGLEYKEQLKQKITFVIQALRRLVKKANRQVPEGEPIPRWIANAKQHSYMACPLKGILPSPVTDQYRNKTEFSVGLSKEGQPTVGYSLGLFRDGIVALAEPDGCRNTSALACHMAHAFQTFIRSSPLPIYSKCGNKGVWRVLLVREGHAASDIAACPPGTSMESFAVRFDPGMATKDDDRIRQLAAPPCTEFMLMVQVCTRDVEKQLLEEELRRLASAFGEAARAAQPPLPLAALFVQYNDQLSNAALPGAPVIRVPLPWERVQCHEETATPSSAGLAGAAADPPVQRDGVDMAGLVAAGHGSAPGGRGEYIFERMCGLKFQISPTAFFQVNTWAAEMLYQTVGEWAGLGAGSLLFDVCCGTGTIGLTLASKVGKVIGIEMNASAIEDAKKNAALNGISNCEFVCGKEARTQARDLLQEASGATTNQGGRCCTRDPGGTGVATGICVQHYRHEQHSGRCYLSFFLSSYQS